MPSFKPTKIGSQDQCLASRSMSYKSYRTDGSRSYYKKDHHSSENAKRWSNNKPHHESPSNSRYEHTKYKKGYEWKETFYPKQTNNHSSNEHKSSLNHVHTKTKHSSSYRKKESCSSDSKNANREKGSEISFLEYIGIETDENIISKRQSQIDIAKASYAYTRYSMFVNKDQRITDMPQTPNKFMKTDTQSWMQTVKKWVHQLRQWEMPGTPSLPSPIWIPEKEPSPKYHHKPNKSPSPSSPIDSDSIESGEYFEKYAPKKDAFYEKKIERKRKRSYTPNSPPRARKFVYNASPKYKRASTYHSKYPHHTYTKKSNYEAFSHSQDYEHESPKVERKVSYVKDYGPRFTHPSRDANFHRKDDLRHKMKSSHLPTTRVGRKYEYERNSQDQRSYTNISWSPVDSPNNSPLLRSRSHRHMSPYSGRRSADVLPRERITSPITPPSILKDQTPEFDIPGQQWQMENELVLIEDA